MSRDRSMPHTRKRLSQNFLTSPAVARQIVRASGVTRGDLVVVVGPGDGMLTRHLLGRVGRVLAYEKDGRLADRLRRRYADDDRIVCREADIRDVRAPREPFAVVANVPFGATTDIVRWCLTADRLVSATLLTQLEFARKHSGDFGRWTKLAVVNWPHFEPTLGARVGKRNFHPVPRVDAAVFHLKRRPEPLVPGRAMRAFRRMVELGFTGAGGSVDASLRRAWPGRAVDRACATARIPKGSPVGLVPPDRWVELFRVLHRARY